MMTLLDQATEGISNAASVASAFVFALGVGTPASRAQSQGMLVIVEQTDETAVPPIQITDARGALMNRLREIHDELLERSKPIPPDVATVLEKHAWDLYVR